MQPSVILCRTQEAHHRALAGAAILDNVKLIANAAAAAWAKEGTAAAQREDRKLRALAFAQTHAVYSEPPCSESRSFSENPDRGFAS